MRASEKARKRGEGVKEVGSRIIRENGGAEEIWGRDRAWRVRGLRVEGGGGGSKRKFSLEKYSSLLLTKEYEILWFNRNGIKDDRERFKYSKPFYSILLIFFFFFHKLSVCIKILRRIWEYFKRKMSGSKNRFLIF